MNKPRLVKKDELMQQEQQSRAEQPSSLKPLTMENVRNWVKEKCSVEPLSPRQKFAALFAPPRTDWVSE